MAPTLQIHLAEVRDIAWTVTGVAGLIAGHGFRLRIPPGAPASDSTSLYLSRVLQRADLHLAYAADSAADELTRSVEALMAYTSEAATLARRTELVITGLDVDDLALSYAVSAPRLQREIPDEPLPQPALDVTDHRTLSDAVLLGSGVPMEFEPTDTAQLRAAAVTLRDCARRLRTAMSSGERPAAMLERFGIWVDEEFTDAVVARDEARASWATAYNAAREEVAEPARLYLSWLSAAARADEQERPALHDAGARARAAVRAYRDLPLTAVACGEHPQLGGGAG
ncbi:hypothetical protein HG717_32325 [Rhodococcus erythropolis]|uniref:hypothetical protein n=1 Tax=Rhodococcus erythropolis TaxID=1833 RepID=UPI001C9A9355|nr:hypothetical protein [Rhodococcus erythropolis]MBY6388571.1 hypothetical protein [Rhodococcus erythropolis]